MGKSKNRCPLVMVEWLDSVQPQASWQHLSDFGKADPVKCYSVGWLISDAERTKALAPNMGLVDGGDMQISGVLTIPTRSITRIVRLREPKIRS